MILKALEFYRWHLKNRITNINCELGNPKKERQELAELEWWMRAFGWEEPEKIVPVERPMEPSLRERIILEEDGKRYKAITWEGM